MSPAARRAGVAVLVALAAIFPLVITSQLATQIGVDTLIFLGAAAA